MSWVTLEDGDGSTIYVKHSYSKARTIEYSYDRSTVHEIDVEQEIIDGDTPSLESGDLTFKLRSKLGTEIWDGNVRTASKTKVVMTVCGAWEQTAGPDIDLS